MLDEDMEMPGQSLEELAILIDYKKQMKLFFEQEDVVKKRREHAMRIGNGFLIFSFGWVGIIVGRYLEKPRPIATAQRPPLPETT